jgi:hypothetical protein
LPPSAALDKFLNRQDESFLRLTKVFVCTFPYRKPSPEQVRIQTNFLLLNKQKIIWITSKYLTHPLLEQPVENLHFLGCVFDDYIITGHLLLPGKEKKRLSDFLNNPQKPFIALKDSALYFIPSERYEKIPLADKFHLVVVNAFQTYAIIELPAEAVDEKKRLCLFL